MYFQKKPIDRCFVFRDDGDVEQLVVSNYGRVFQAKVLDNYTKVEDNGQYSYYGPYYSLNSLLSTTFYLSHLVVVSNKTVLLSYGGITSGDATMDGIFKYSSSANTWLRVAKMQFPRSAPVVVPVTGLDCP